MVGEDYDDALKIAGEHEYDILSNEPYNIELISEIPVETKDRLPKGWTTDMTPYGSARGVTMEAYLPVPRKLKEKKWRKSFVRLHCRSLKMRRSKKGNMKLHVSGLSGRVVKIKVPDELVSEDHFPGRDVSCPVKFERHARTGDGRKYELADKVVLSGSGDLASVDDIEEGEI